MTKLIFAVEPNLPPLRRPRPPIPVEEPKQKPAEERKQGPAKRDIYRRKQGPVKRDIYRRKQGPVEKPKEEEPTEELKPFPFRKLKVPLRRPRPRPRPKRPLSQRQLGKEIDYKDVKLLRQFISDQGKILPRRVTRLNLKQQRLITLAIKKARILSFLPFIYNAKNFERIKSTIIRPAKFRNKKKKFKQKEKIQTKKKK